MTSRIIPTAARHLSVTDLRVLLRFCDNQRESLWSGLDLQQILDVYHLSAEWDGVEAWLQNAPSAPHVWSMVGQTRLGLSVLDVDGEHSALVDFLRANEEDEATCRAVCALDVAQSIMLGGGAVPRVVVTRIE